MRMWLLDPRKMCRNHLLGEHVELHMLVGSINKGMNLDGYDGIIEPSKIKERHGKLVVEMERRGYNHKSPLKKFNVGKYGELKVDVRKSKSDIRERCNKCRV